MAVGVAKDAEQAVSWYRRAADAGHAGAFRSALAAPMCYSHGRMGWPKNLPSRQYSGTAEQRKLGHVRGSPNAGARQSGWMSVVSGLPGEMLRAFECLRWYLSSAAAESGSRVLPTARARTVFIRL